MTHRAQPGRKQLQQRSDAAGSFPKRAARGATSAVSKPSPGIGGRANHTGLVAQCRRYNPACLGRYAQAVALDRFARRLQQPIPRR